MPIPSEKAGEAASEAAATSEITLLIMERLVSWLMFRGSLSEFPSSGEQPSPGNGHVQPVLSYAVLLPLQWFFRENLGGRSIMIPSETPSARKSPLKSPLFYSSLILACVALYVLYVLYARYDSNRRYEQQTRQHQEQQRRQNDLSAVEQLGGSDLAIRGFYVSPAIIRPGQSAQLCYDVANAKTVTLVPPVAAVWPSHSRCFDVSPKKTTTYTLSISDSVGKSVSEAVELKVQ
jgi:hypothetical protein